jgi:hypothetical protein
MLSFSEIFLSVNRPSEFSRNPLETCKIPATPLLSGYWLVCPVIVAEVALAVVGWQVVQLFYHVTTGGFILPHWSAVCEALHVAVFPEKIILAGSA